MSTFANKEVAWRDLVDPRKILVDFDLEAGLKEPEFENLEIPESFGPVSLLIDEHKIRRFSFTQGDYDAWYNHSQCFGRRVGQPCLLGNDLLQLFTLKYKASHTVGLHTEEQMWFDSPVFEGEVVSLEGRYVDAYQARGHGYVVMEASAVGEDGRSIVRHRGIEILKTVPGNAVGRGDANPGKRVTGVVPDGAEQVKNLSGNSRPGQVVVPMYRSVSFEQAGVFSRAGEFVRNIHNDLEIARRGGLRLPIVQGQQQVGIIGEYLAKAFGERWFTRGWLKVKFVNSLEILEPMTVQALVTETVPDENGSLRITVELWIRRHSDGKLTTVGWACCTV